MRCFAESTELAALIEIKCAETGWLAFWNFLPNLSPIVLMVSVVVAMFVAWRSIKAQQQIARQRTTLDLIERFESAEHYQELLKTFSSYRRSNKLRLLVNPDTKKHKAARQRINDFLNHYELVGLCIRSGILSLDLYREWMAPAVISTWNGAAPYIQFNRWQMTDGNIWRYDSKAYEHLEWLVDQWRVASIDSVVIKLGPDASKYGEWPFELEDDFTTEHVIGAKLSEKQ